MSNCSEPLTSIRQNHTNNVSLLMHNIIMLLNSLIALLSHTCKFPIINYLNPEASLLNMLHTMEIMAYRYDIIKEDCGKFQRTFNLWVFVCLPVCLFSAVIVHDDQSEMQQEVVSGSMGGWMGGWMVGGGYDSLCITTHNQVSKIKTAPSSPEWLWLC
jgi:hypothetical protein